MSPVTDTTYREALREAIRVELGRDERTFVMGVDVGRYGGCYAVTRGLLEEFGPERVRDAPLSESAIVGAGVGAALGGMRPIIEIMTVNFSMLAMDQIVNTAALLCHMSGGQFSVPIVIRMATGAGRQVAAQHSHSLEAWYAHVPGLKVAAPATVEDARWMLHLAVEDPDPVILFEHVSLYGTSGSAGYDEMVDLERARIRRRGADATVVAYGGSLPKALEAADILAGMGIDAEVLDLRMLRPLDTATILESVARTHHAIVIDEGWRSVSIAAEVSARIAEEALWDLDGPVRRVCSAEVPIPYAAHMEAAALPQVDDVVAAVRMSLAA